MRGNSFLRSQTFVYSRRDFFVCLFFILLWITPAAQSAAKDGTPRIVEHPASLVVARGDPATLNCAAQGIPHPKITWFRDGVKVTTSEQDPHSHRVLFSSGSLFFLAIKQGKKESDAGVYTCLATNENGTARSKNATLTIAVLREEFRVLPMSVSAASGERAEILCVPPKGHPTPELTWSRNGHEIDLNEEPNRIQVLDPGTLVIKEVLQTDEGEYVCHATNPAGKRSSPPAILNVLVSPFWVKAPRDVIGVAGGETEISCRAGGDPPPVVTWRRVGGHISVGRMRIVRDRGLLVSHLRPYDSGTYVCNAANRAASISANASLTVYSAPVVQEIQGDVEVEEGASLQLSCAVQGFPVPLVYWAREGSQRLLPATREFIELSSAGQSDEEEGLMGVKIIFTVKKVNKHHSGRYICGGVNSAGGVMTPVLVRIRLPNLLPPPIISVPPANQTLPIGGQADLTCRVWGSPAPTVTWRHRGRLVTSTTRRHLLPDNTLSIHELVTEDEGEYVCLASSTRGVTEAKAHLNISSPNDAGVVFHEAPDPESAPGPPSTPNVMATNATAALLEWDVPAKQGASPVHGYVVEYYSNLDPAWKIVTPYTKHTTFTLTPISPSYIYGVTVRAKNDHGTSEPSGIAEVGGDGNKEAVGIEDSELKNTRVVLQEAVLTGPASAKILWQMTEEVSSVEGFYIRLHHMSRDEYLPDASAYNGRPHVKGSVGNFTVVTVVNAGGGASSYVLHGLYHFRSYTVFLVPFYKTFEGAPSNSRTFLTSEAAPSAPPQDVRMQLTNVTTASVFWFPPPPLHRNGHITSYQVDIVSVDGEVFLSRTVNGSTTTLKVHNLTLGISYHLSIAASTKAGRGPFTKPVSLHVDPVLLHPLAKSGPSLVSLDGDVWVIGMIGAAVFCLLLVSIATLLIWRRHARNKALGHVGVSVHKMDNLSVGDSSLWQDYGGWQLEKVCGASLPDVKVMNTAGTLLECDGSAPRNLVTFYRGASSNEGPYATTALLGPHSLPHQSGKSHKESHRSSDVMSEQHTLVDAKKATERNYNTDGNRTLRRLKGSRPMIPAPPLPCHPPPGVPTDSRSHTPCYCSGSRASHMTESPYSEAHYTPTLCARPCYHTRPDHQHPHAPHSICPSSHVYASANPLSPYQESNPSRSSLASGAGVWQQRLSSGSAVYESASVQYAPAGYYLPSSMASSFTSTNSDAASGVSVGCGVERVVERAVQSSLPSLTYQAIKALGEDIEAFRNLQQLIADQESNRALHNMSCNHKTSPTLQGPATAAVATSSSTPSTMHSHLSSNNNNNNNNNIHHHPHHHHHHQPQQQKLSAAGVKHELNNKHETKQNSIETPDHNNHPIKASQMRAGGVGGGGPFLHSLGGSLILPPIDIEVAPLGEGESDCQDEEDEEDDGECSGCSCTCSEAESSVYAETDFADEVRATLQETSPTSAGAGEGGRGDRKGDALQVGIRRHRHKRRPHSTYSVKSNYINLPTSPQCTDSLPIPSCPSDPRLKPANNQVSPTPAEKAIAHNAHSTHNNPQAVTHHHSPSQNDKFIVTSNVL
ncbi:LOW QUALITY PROTEIN: protein sax-3-like [Palaemon carinicauda]|uniref:LOW QUALITY PROTEIN: protein sax-3-like n=1 Tax=Palaemon carinicauda TaxID=392227 RepID=UPI0035B633D2